MVVTRRGSDAVVYDETEGSGVDVDVETDWNV